jgi:glycosyltransferase involved in cell wall biosynthesis
MAENERLTDKMNVPADHSSPLHKCKIIMVHQSLEMGGAERQGLILARWLEEQHGADVEVWGLRFPGTAARWCDERRIRWRLVPWEWSGSRVAKIMGLLRFLQALKGAKADVLLPFTMPPNIVCGLLWRWSGVRTCIWNQRDEGRQRFAPWLERRAVRDIPCFISNSDHAAEFLTSELGVSHRLVEVIHNGIELAPPLLSREAWRSRLGVDSQTPMACMIANLHAYKDHVTLLHAWALVKEESARAVPRLLLAGHDYGTGEPLAALAKSLGISAQVNFLGHVEDVSGLLKASDLAVYSSLKEGVPNGVLECMAAGLPVVATDIPGNREALGPENSRFLVEPEDPAALARGILQFLNDPGLSQAAGQLNLDRVRRQFGKERMCTRYVQAIITALGECPAWQSQRSKASAQR